MTEETGKAVTVSRTAAVAALLKQPSKDFWPLISAIAGEQGLETKYGAEALVRLEYGYGEKGGRAMLKRPPTAAERSTLARGPEYAEAASGRLEPGNGRVLEAALGKMILIFPLRKMSPEAWKVWAGTYSQVLGDCPDECIADAADHWIATKAERMPAPAEFGKLAKALQAKRLHAVDLCRRAPEALKNWDDDHAPRPHPPARAAAA